MKARIPIPTAAIRDFCRRWQVTEFALFGSVLRDDFGPDSDIDILVTFAIEARWSFAQLVEMRQELENLWSRRVDLVEKQLVEGGENYIRRRHILDHAEPVDVA